MNHRTCEKNVIFMIFAILLPKFIEINEHNIKQKKTFRNIVVSLVLQGGITMSPRHSLHNKLGVKEGRYLLYTIMCKFNIFIF